MKTVILKACVMRRLAANVPQNAVPQNAVPQHAVPQHAVPCNTKTGTMRRLSDAQSVSRLQVDRRTARKQPADRFEPSHEAFHCWMI